MIFTPKIAGSEKESEKYNLKMKQLNEQGEMFAKMAVKIADESRKRQKAESKKRRRSPVVVNGGTNKDDIRRLQRTLRQKIAEVIAEDDDQKVKTVRVSELQRKLDALERVLSQIEAAEREAAENRRGGRKKRLTESVFLRSDDITVNKKGFAEIDVSVSAVSGMGSRESNIDLTAGFEAAAVSADAANVDVIL